MSSNDKEARICTRLQEGAMYNMLKPGNPNDLWNVCQHAVDKEEEKVVVVEELSDCAGEASSLPSKRDYSHDQDDFSADPSLVSESKENLKGGTKRKMMEMYGEQLSAPPVKAKIVWTNTLHDRFLRAIDVLGMDKAVPKKILEIMNVPGLTRENIASHLQKYRLFLKRYGKNNSPKFKSPEKSNFALNTLPLSSSSNEHSRLLQLGFGKVPSFIHDKSPSFLQNLTLGAQSSSSTLPGLGLDKSHPILHQTSANSSFSSSIQKSPSTLGLNFPLQGNAMHMHPKDNLAPLDLCKHKYQSQQNGPMPYSAFIPSTFGFNNGLALNNNERIGTMGYSIFPSEVLSLNPPVSNYAGIRLTSNAELVGGGQGGGSLLQFSDIGINKVGKNNPNEFDMTNLQGLPPMAIELQFVAHQGDYSNFNVDTVNGPALPNDNNTYYQRLLGNDDHSSVFKQQVIQPYKNGRDILDHPNIEGSYIADYENNAPPNELSEFSKLCHFQDSVLPSDPSSVQEQGGNRVQLMDSIHPLLNQISVEQMVPKENTMDQEKEEYVEAMLRTICELLED